MSLFNCGFQHHLCVECRFHLATFVGSWLISTVGDYINPLTKKRDTIGSGRAFETFVFTTDGKPDPESGHPTIIGWNERDSNEYMHERAACEGHEAMVAKYAALGEET